MIIERELRNLEETFNSIKDRVDFSDEIIRIIIKNNDNDKEFKKINNSLKTIISECSIDKTINKDLYNDTLERIDSDIIKKFIKEYIKINKYNIKDIFNEDIKLELDIEDDDLDNKNEEENNEYLKKLKEETKKDRRICKEVTNARDMYIKEMSYIPRLSEEETVELFKERDKITDSVRKKEIENKLIESNLRLVYSIAWKYSNKAPLEDLISEGALGLAKGIQKFDVNRGYKLSTYVSFWIHQNISRYIEDNGNTVRISSNLYQKMKKLDFKTKQYIVEHDGKEPTTEELMKLTGLSALDIENCKKFDFRKVSINKQVGDDGESDGDELGDFIADSNSEKEIYDNTYKIELVTKVDELLDYVFPIDIPASRKKDENIRSRFVLKHRFGLNGEQPKTLKEVSLLLNVTTERVRQIEAKALRRLRQNNNTKSLKLFLDE